MGLMGSLLGSVIGLTLGGPLGAIAGAALGHGLSETADRRFSSQERAQASYFITVFSMLAKIARADGHVHEREIEMAQRFMREELDLDSDSERAAIKIFRAAKDSPLRFENFAEQFHDMFSHDHEVLVSMLDLLTRMAMADGRLDPGEASMLESAARIFRLDPHTVAHIFARHGAAASDGRQSSRGRGAGQTPPPPPTATRHYAVLDLEPSASDDEVKSRYRKLVAENHPDKIMAKGLPEEFVKFAEQRFREIQDAYEAIKAERGLR